MAIDHFGLSVPSDAFDKIVSHYLAALAPLGYKKIMEFPGVVGLGSDKPDFWIVGVDEYTKASKGIHLAFGTNSRELVDECYEAAVKAGGRDNGKPGTRPEYHQTYYGAFWFDAMDNNVEVVCHCSA